MGRERRENGDSVIYANSVVCSGGREGEKMKEVEDGVGGESCM